MTQNKKFKKLVRARMEKTGESYTAARRSLLKDQPEQKGPWDGGTTYKSIGYWKSVEAPHWPDPLEMVDASWGSSERAKVIDHLENGYNVNAFMGNSWCRLGCKRDRSDGMKRAFFEAYGTNDEKVSWEERRAARHDAAKRSEEANMKAEEVASLDMGSLEFTDGVYVWPEGLVHYVREHNIRLPKEFVDHVLRGDHPMTAPEHGTGEFVYDELWWRAVGTAQRARLAQTPDLDKIREVLRRTWSKVYDGKTILYHVYEDGPEDGRVHTSLCGTATTKTFETKTPGAPDCEKCRLLKIRALMARQKLAGDPFNILHDPVLWAAAGGDEEDRIAQRNELWGAPPERPPRTVEVAIPFNKGWYFYDGQYPDEGTVGPYKDLADATQTAKLAGYDPFDEASVRFIQQPEQTDVIQRYIADEITRELKPVIAAQPPNAPAQYRQMFSQLLGRRLSAVVEKLEKQGVLVPPEQDFELRVPPRNDKDDEDGIFRASVVIKNPERYPEFIRDLTEMGLVNPTHMLSIKMREDA